MVKLAQGGGTRLAKSGRTRAAILEQAIQLASVVGLDGLSIGALAQRMHLSKSGLFAHFGSKDALQLAIIETGFLRFAELVIGPAQRRPRGVETLWALFDGWVRWSHERLDGGCLFVTASVEFDDRPGPVREYLVEAYRQFHAVIGAAVQRAATEGDMRADVDVPQFINDFNGVMLGYNLADRLFHDPDAERRAHRALERLLEDAKS